VVFAASIEFGTSSGMPAVLALHPLVEVTDHVLHGVGPPLAFTARCGPGRSEHRIAVLHEQVETWIAMPEGTIPVQNERRVMVAEHVAGARLVLLPVRKLSLLLPATSADPFLLFAEPLAGAFAGLLGAVIGEVRLRHHATPRHGASLISPLALECGELRQRHSLRCRVAVGTRREAPIVLDLRRLRGDWGIIR
jgi:hypothetical protein